MVQSTLGPVRLDRDAETPLYLQLSEHIAAQIRSQALSPGTKLPPTRELASELGLNRQTVSSAYEALASAGLVRSRVGHGTVVDGARAFSVRPSGVRFSKAVQALERVDRDFAPRSSHPDPIDFASLIPDEGLFPIEPFRQVVDSVLERQGKELLQYGPVAGYPPLRAHIAERLAARGVSVRAEHVQIVNGSQQALDLIFRALLDPGDAVAVESPTYFVVLPALAQYQADVVPIPMTPTGMDLDALETTLARRPLKLIYTMPTFHNPTGISMGEDERRALVALAERHQVNLVEDDFDADLRFDGDTLLPLKALDRAELVLYIGTFSKGLFPGLRLGWVVAPEPIARVLGRVKRFSDYHTSLLLQAAVLEFARLGHYDEHLKSLARVGHEKRKRLVDAMRRHFPKECTWTPPDGGHAFWLTLPDGVSSETLLSEGEREGVLFTPGTAFFVGGGGSLHLRLSISRVSADRIDEGVRRLAAIVKRQMKALRSRSGASGVGEPVFHI